MADSRAIGVFDSGVGGLIVVKELLQQMPNEDIIYFGDTARVPYGIKSKDTIIKFTLESIFFLLKFDVKMIIIACNTASALALPLLKRQFKAQIIGVISPGVKEAVYATKNKKIGVIATRATINSGSYEEHIKKINPEIEVYSRSCPMFVPLVEEGYLNHKITYEVAKEYLTCFKKSGIDTLILGCTHYPLLKPVIQQVMGKNIRLIDSAKQVVSNVADILKEEEMRASHSRKAKVQYFVSDEAGYFANVGRKFLGRQLQDVKKAEYV